jgi:hypothetical protein
VTDTGKHAVVICGSLAVAVAAISSRLWSYPVPRPTGIMAESNRIQTVALGLLGAAVGGCIGYFAFFWLVRQGVYALVLPPALLGLGAGICARRRSTPLAVVCGLAGLALGLLSEWQFAPFIADERLLYFITHIHTLKPFTLLLLVIGTILSYRLALGFDSKSNVSFVRNGN